MTDSMTKRRIKEVKESERLFEKYANECPFCKGRGKLIYDKATMLKMIKKLKKVGGRHAYRLLKKIDPLGSQKYV